MEIILLNDKIEIQNFHFIGKLLKLIFLLLSMISFKINYKYIFNRKDSKNIKVCLCTIGKKENLYAKEFVEHYKKIGYNHIFIYDNNEIGDEKFEDVLYNEIKNNFVTIIDYRRLQSHSEQLISYFDCYNKNKNDYDWFSFFDFDEFLYIKNNKTIQEFLGNPKFNQCHNIKINWLIYSDNNLIFYENKPLTERFTSPLMDCEPNRCIKSTVRNNLKINFWTKFDNPHCSTVKHISCDTFGEIIQFDSPYNIPNYEFAYIKHYWTKTLEEFCIKIERGYPDRKVVIDKSYLIDKFKSFFSLNQITKEKLQYIKKKYNISEKEIFP